MNRRVILLFTVGVAMWLATVRAASADPLLIMPLGDSNTGVDPLAFPGVPPDHPAFDNLSKYRQLLAELLADRGCDIDFVGTQHTGDLPLADWDHEGHGGYRIDQIVHGYAGDEVNGIQDWLVELGAAGQLPDVVLVMLGTNDMLQGQVYRNGAAANLGGLLDLLLARVPDAHIYIASIPPLVFSDPQWNQFVIEFNDQIRDLAASRAAVGDNVHFVDVNAWLTFSDIASDGINLNAAGLDKTAQAWNQAIQLPEPAVNPEPATLALQALGSLLPVAALRRRRKCRHSPFSRI